MCEWLSHAEWCDVKLLCGGRSFSAHRAVLASVSKFMRCLLLSCPLDETTFIVLPDFDLEAMSSVLYYIYNGEVIVPKSKLELFLDIIQAMQIYVDRKYLSNLKNDIAEGFFNFNSSCIENVQKTETFTLCFESDKDQKCFNIKRGREMPSKLFQYSQSKTDFHDNIVRRQNESELRRSRFGNLKSPYGDRQRNSFLRDLFIETYPRNGNVNGLTEGVLAISNECYHSPASVLSTNANGKHLNDDALSSVNTQITQQSANVPSIFHIEQNLKFHNNHIGKCTCNEPSCVKCPMRINDASYNSDNDNVTELQNDNICLMTQQIKNKMLGINTGSASFRPLTLEAAKCLLMKDSEAKSLIRSERNGKRSHSISNFCPKIIFNQVLENPWTPRKPVEYKPLRQKDENVETLYQKVEKCSIVNDSNNNVQTAAVAEFSEQITDSVSYEIIEPTTSTSVMNLRTCSQNFKCIQCNQVFTSSESLAVHMRRHSTTARYTCGECGKTFSQLRNFKYHMSIHRGTREFAATCTVCGKYFNDRGYLSSHMKIHRNRKEYKCTLCPKSFNQRVAYNMHVRIHTGVKPHVCEECGKAFSRKMLLKQHQRTHSGERPYACPHCDKRFADRSNMTLHLRLHTGVKPFSCSLCPKSFTKKHHLKSHLNFHTGSKPYACPRCKLAFTQSSNMRTHLKKCSAPGPSAASDTHTHS